MDLENVIPSDVRERHILYDNTYTWNLKNNIDESICKQTHRHKKKNYGSQRGGGGRDKLGEGN